jgi:hypothetical protein
LELFLLWLFWLFLLWLFWLFLLWLFWLELQSEELFWDLLLEF